MSERTPIFSAYFQKELLALIIRSTKFLTEIRPLIKPEHFLSEEQSIICQVAYNYFDHYRKAPRKHLRTDLEKYVEETRISKERHSLTKKYLKHLERTQPQNQKYLKDELADLSNTRK